MDSVVDKAAASDNQNCEASTMPTKHRAQAETYAIAVYKTHTFRQLQAIGVAFLKSRGVKMMSYHHLPPPGAKDFDPTVTIAAYGFPEDWVKRYIERRYYEVDPIPQHAQQVTAPFWWSDVAKLPGLSEAAIDYLDDLTQAHLGDGLGVPVFGPHGRNGYFGIGFGEANPQVEHVRIVEIQWACQLGHQRYCDLLAAELEKPASLSTREREIIHWVVRGKSNSVIADLLGISAHTVDTHMRRVYQKFGVSDRVTAALRALAMGEIV